MEEIYTIIPLHVLMDIRIQHSEEPGGTCAGKKNSEKLNAWQK